MSNSTVFSVVVAIIVAAATAYAALMQADAVQADVTSDANQVSLTVSIAELQPVTLSQDDHYYTHFTIPSEGTTYQPDKPILPMVSRFIIVPPQAVLELSVQSDQPRTVRPDTPPLICNDNSVMLTDVQNHDNGSLYPPVIAEMSEPFVMRGVRMVKVTTYPVQYNSENGSYLIRDNITAQVRYSDGNPVNPAYHPDRSHRSREFLKFIENFAVNGSDVGRDQTDDISPYVGHYLIVSHENCLEYAAPFIEWRRKSGYKMDILSIASNMALNVNAVKELIQDRYDAYLDEGIDPFDQILLIGDRTSYYFMGAHAWQIRADEGNTLWTPGGPHADYLFACLEGDDHHPDVGFARLAAGNRELMELTVGRTLSYESQPYMEETEWFTKGSVFSQWWGNSPESAWHIGIPMNVRWGLELLERLGFDDISFYEGLEYDPNGDDIQPWLEERLNDGQNLMIGRAQVQRWRERFQVNDNVVFPIYIATNGLGDYGGDALFRTGDGDHLKGPVLSTYVYGDTPTIPMSFLWLEMVNGMLNRDLTAGWARVGAITNIERYMADYNYQGMVGAANIYLHVKTDFECYGDPGIQQWMGVPRRVTLQFPESVSPVTRLVELSVMDEDGNNPVAGAQVTLYAPGDMPDFDADEYADYEDMYMRTALSDEDGFVRFVLDDIELIEDTPLMLTVTGRDILPLFEEAEIAAPEGATVELSGYTLTEQEGNDDGEINPGELFTLNLTAINLGGEALQNVTATGESLSPWIEVDDGVVQFGDLDGGAEEDGENVIELLFHPTTPDGEARPSTNPVIKINFTADGDLNWSSAITLDPQAPCFDLFEIIGGGIIEGQDVDLNLDIANRGRMLSAPMVAEISSLGNGIIVVEDESIYEQIDAGGHEVLAGDDFLVSVSPIAIPGSMCDMMMILTGDDDFVDTVFFRLQAGQTAENEPFGPDAYGYVCFDDTDEGWELAPQYDWVEISLDERDRDFNGLSCDFDGVSDVQGFEDVGESVVVDLGFVAQMYGQQFDQITICSNGFVAIGNQEQMINFQNWPLDRAMGGGVGMIAPFWDWLELNDDAQVYYFRDAERGRFIVEWYKLRHYNLGDDDLTFELIIYDPEQHFIESGDSDILFQYREISNILGVDQGRAAWERNSPYASVGISSPDGTTGINYTWHNIYPRAAAELEERRAILFTTGIVRREGQLFGVVTDAATGDPIPDARIITGHGFVGDSDDEGRYRIENAPAEVSFTMTATAEGYLDSTRGDLVLHEDEELEVNFALLHAEFELSHQELTAGIVTEEQVSIDIPFTITNAGNGPLEWYAEKRLPDNAHLDPWELRESLSIGEVVDDSRLKGVVFIDNHYYVSGGGSSGRDDNYIYVFNRAGELVNSFLQYGDSRFGVSDLTWDGELIWGGADETFYGFTPDGEMIESFEGPYPNQAITWDPDRELLWISGKTSRTITGYTREGELVAELSRHGLTVYGFAYSPVDPGFLYVNNYVHTPGEDDQTEVNKIHIDTDEMQFVTRLNSPGKPEGAFITNMFDPYSTVLIAMENTSDPSDRINIWQLDANTAWFNMESYDGILDPAHELELTMTLDAEWLIPLQIENEMGWDAELFFTTNSMQGDISLPIRFDVMLSAPLESNPLPTEFSLTSIYPNPFNAQLNIAYDVSTTMDVTLELFDLTGRLVSTLVDAQLTAGSHTAHWDGSTMTSGIYLVRLKSEERTLTRKIVLTK